MHSFVKSNYFEIPCEFTLTEEDLNTSMIKMCFDIKEIHKECNELEVQSQLFKLKNKLGKFDTRTVSTARRDCDMFSHISYVAQIKFKSRAVWKLAELDHLYDLTEKTYATCKGKKFAFVDICYGNGSFSQYLINRCEEQRRPYRGLGITLLENSSTHHPPKGLEVVWGKMGNGDICEVTNIDEFIQKSQEGNTVNFDLCVADGAISLDSTGMENFQEILSQRLLLCQCLTVLSISSTNGDAVVKFFDLFTTFSKQLIFLMSLCYEKIFLHKPKTSRGANSERYLVCKKKREQSTTIRVVSYLKEINCFFSFFKFLKRDIYFSNIINSTINKKIEYFKYKIFIDKHIDESCKNQIENLKLLLNKCENSSFNFYTLADKQSWAIYFCNEISV